MPADENLDRFESAPDKVITFTYDCGQKISTVTLSIPSTPEATVVHHWEKPLLRKTGSDGTTN